MIRHRLATRPIRVAALAPVALLVTAFADIPITAEAGMSAPSAAPAMVQAPIAARWSIESARDLLSVIRSADKEGLSAAAYDPAALERAIEAGPGQALDMAADASGIAIARDFLLGRVQDRSAFDWHIERSPYEAFALNEGLAEAAASGRVRDYLAGLLPQSAGYRALRTALAQTAEPERMAMIRANMERWRWLPREMGDDYLFVNIPTYQLSLVKGGAEEARYDVVVGAPKTPTPSLAVAAERVVVNPWWTLPPSVLAEGGSYPASKGYVTRRTDNGRVLVQQKPGPMNALGRIKIDMPNPHAIYLHDTPAKAAFARTERALSHGCIRVKGIDQLASQLQDTGEVDTALAGRDTANIALARQIPVYIVYMTADAGADGLVKPLKDIYARDPRLLAALDRPVNLAARHAGTRLASR